MLWGLATGEDAAYVLGEEPYSPSPAPFSPSPEPGPLPPPPPPDDPGDHGDLPENLVVPFIILAILLTAMAGMMSGLTLGLMSLDQVDLEVGAGAGRSAEARPQALGGAPGCRTGAAAAPSCSELLRPAAVGLRAAAPCLPCLAAATDHVGPRTASTRPRHPPQVLRRSGTDRQKALAERIMPLLANPHALLCTLLVCNALAAEALPLVLDRLADPATAIVVSVTAGEHAAEWR